MVARLAELEGECTRLRDQLRVATYRLGQAEQALTGERVAREAAERAIGDDVLEMVRADVVPRSELIRSEHRVQALATWCRAHGVDPGPILRSRP